MKIQLAEPVELVEEIVELLVEPELMVQVVEGAERRQQAVLPELLDLVVELEMLVLQTQVELELMELVEVEEEPVCMVEVEEVETMMAELVEAVAQVSEL